MYECYLKKTCFRSISV